MIILFFCFFYIVAEKPLGGSFNKCMYVCMYVCTIRSKKIKDIRSQEKDKKRPENSVTSATI